MTLDQMPFATAKHILNMIAYGCIGRGGFGRNGYDLLLCRSRKLLPTGETLPEFQDCVSGDEVDHAAYEAAKRLTRSLTS